MEHHTKTPEAVKDSLYIAAATTQAQKLYRARLVAACDKLDQVREALAVHEMRQDRQPGNFGFAGDMGYVNEKLDEVLAFLGKK